MTQSTDQTMARIIEAVELGQRGQSGPARARLDALWQRIGPAGDPFHRCVLAHHLADLQDDPAEELRWDLLALEAAQTLTDERVRRHDTALAVEAFRPSLWLNLAEDYRRLGQLDRAREHLALARDGAAALGDDGYGELIRSGIQRLTEALAEAGTARDGPAPVGSRPVRGDHRSAGRAVRQPQAE